MSVNVSIIAAAICVVLVAGTTAGCALDDDIVDEERGSVRDADITAGANISSGISTVFRLGRDGVGWRTTQSGDEEQFRFDPAGITSSTSAETCTFVGNALFRSGEKYLYLADDKRIFSADGVHLYTFAGPNVLAPHEPPLARLTQEGKAFIIGQSPPWAKLLVAAVLAGICGSTGL